jgi:hypothetical protein
VLAVAAVEVVVVATVAATQPTDGALAVVVSLLLAPIGVWAVAGIAERIAGTGLGLLAAALYVVLPVTARVFFANTPEDTLRAGFDRHVLPSLVGTRAPGWFALGVGLAVVVRVASPKIAGPVALLAAAVAIAVWIDAPWTRLYDNFHESTWSPTLVCALPLACLIGVAFRSPWLAAALGGWLGFFVLRGVHHPYGNGGFWTALAAALPAIAVLIAALGLLVPRLQPEGKQVPAADVR